MPRPFAPHTVETTLLSPWSDSLAMAAQTPASGWEVVPDDGEMWRRATACYAQLRVLPRRVHRALQRKLALPLAGVALLLALGQGLSSAATIVVDGTTYTLVDAITAANMDTAQGAVQPAAGPTPYCWSHRAAP